jgi:hypothetical protein
MFTWRRSGRRRPASKSPPPGLGISQPVRGAALGRPLLPGVMRRGDTQPGGELPSNIRDKRLSPGLWTAFRSDPRPSTCREPACPHGKFQRFAARHSPNTCATRPRDNRPDTPLSPPMLRLPSGIWRSREVSCTVRCRQRPAMCSADYSSRWCGLFFLNGRGEKIAATGLRAG